MNTTNLLKIQQLVAANPDKWEVMVKTLEFVTTEPPVDNATPKEYKVTEKDIGALMKVWDSDVENIQVGILTEIEGESVFRTVGGIPWVQAEPHLGDIKLHMIPHTGGLISPKLNLTLGQFVILKTDRGVGIYSSNPSLWRNVTHYRVISLLPIKDSDYV